MSTLTPNPLQPQLIRLQLSLSPIHYNNLMGPINSKSNNQFEELLKRFKIVRTNPQQRLTYLQDINEKGSDYLCRQVVDTSKASFDQKIKEIQDKKKLLDNPHVVQLSEYMVGEQKEYCGVYHKIYILFKYPHRSLEDEVLERITEREKFEEDEIWSIIASCILGMSHLQANKIHHQAISSKTILIDNKGSVKVADPYCALEISNYSKMLSKKRPEHIYLSPELCQCLDNTEVTPSGDVDPYRSDVFTFGMVIIETALLKYLDDCYREDNTKVDWDTIRFYLNQVEQIYGAQLKEFIEKLVSDPAKRPDWLELKLHMKNDGKSSAGGKNSQIQNYPQTNPRPQSHVQLQPQPHTHLPYAPTPVVVDNRPHYPIQHTHLHLGGYPQEYRPVSQIPVAQGTPVHITEYTGTRPPVFVSQPPASHVTALPIVTSQPQSQTSYAEITPIQASNINFVRPVLGTRPADSYITHTKIDQNLVEVSDDQDEIQTNEGSSNPRSYNPNPQVVRTGNGYNPRPYAPPTIDNRYNSIPSSTHSTNISYHTNSNFNPSPVILTGHSSPHHQALNHQESVSSNPQQRFVSNLPFGGLPHHGSGFARPASNIAPHAVGQGPMNAYKHIDTNNLFTDYQKLGIKKSDHNIANIAPQSYYTKPDNRPPSQQDAPRSNPVQTPPVDEVQRVIETFSQGSRYEGEKVNGMRHGKGKFYYQDGGLYDGEWRQNKMCGKGKLFYQSGKLAYDGNWDNDQFTGFGILYNQQPQVLKEPYNYDNFNDMEEVWTRYQGYFVDDKKQGDGKLYFSNKEYYSGQFDDDAVNGNGVFYRLDGSKVKGVWEDNHLISTTN